MSTVVLHVVASLHVIVQSFSLVPSVAVLNFTFCYLASAAARFFLKDPSSARCSGRAMQDGHHCDHFAGRVPTWCLGAGAGLNLAAVFPLRR